MKFQKLKQIIKQYESVLVAFSGGIDSTFVLKVARDVLGRDRVKAVTASSKSVPERELEEAKKIAIELDVKHQIIQTQEMDNPAYRSNPMNRCYFCKTELYDHLIPTAKAWNLKTICNGTNLDDLSDHRPGLIAASEQGIKSPLVEAGLTKKEVRELSREMGIRIWDKSAAPCLSSRFPYGHEITAEKLKQVETGENFLKDLGFKVIRLRHYGKKACLELGQEEFIRLMDVALRNQVTEFILSLGFKTAVFESYQSGRLNTLSFPHVLSGNLESRSLIKAFGNDVRENS